MLRLPSTHKTMKLSQPTKKFDCCARFQVKKNYRFPKFSIIKDTKHLRDVNSKALKEALCKLKLEKKTFFKENFGHLEYVCMIPQVRFNLTIICLSFPSIHHLCHPCDFVDRDNKMHSTVLSTRQNEFFHNKLYPWPHVQRN